MKKILSAIPILLLVTAVFSQSHSESFRMILHDHWQMQSALTDRAVGKDVSSPGFAASHWYPVTVPTTIIAGLLANHEYDFDPFYAQNFKKLADERLDHAWWFRTSFRLPASEQGKNVILSLHGINYKANIWLNGKRIADSNYIVGPFRKINLDISAHISYSGENVLAIELRRPYNPNRRGGDLAIDYADWIHYPPDYNGGIVNNVEIKTFDKIGVQHPLVTTHFAHENLDTAYLQVDAEAVNYTGQPQSAVITARINEGVTAQVMVQLRPYETLPVRFSPADYPQLRIGHPRIWWPWQYGEPQLNRVEVSALVNGKTSNSVAENFGIREITSKMLSNASRQFIINGKPILLRGAAWSPDIFQRRSENRQEQELRLVRDMHMNIVRSEGKFEDDHFYDLCDQYGLLVMTGWMCCGAWQYPELWNAEKRRVAMASDSSMMYWLRNKACIVAWLNGSDMPPRDTTVERDWLAIEHYLNWPSPILATADASKSKVSGYSGVKMNGPYDWVPPAYWENDPNKYGGAWSFATEISPGPAIPPYESLIRFLPQDSIDPANSDWLYHCGTMQFGNTRIFDTALERRYGPAKNIHDYINHAQLQNYEGERAMMEGYGIKKYQEATGVVQWMLSNPWPSLIWHTYDYYLNPAGSYFGVKKALEPLHVMYSYKSGEVAIVNSWQQAFDGLSIKANVYNLDGSLQYSHTAACRVQADAVERCFAIPSLGSLSDVYFLRLELRDAAGKSVSINWYWLSRKADELNWKASKWYYTPQSAFADFRALDKLPATTLQVSMEEQRDGDSTTRHIHLSNTGKSVAFFIRLRLVKEKDGQDVLPILFTDNYFSLAPGEERSIECRYANTDAGDGGIKLMVSGENVKGEGVR